MSCPFCSAPLSTNARFCAACGRALTAKPEAPAPKTGACGVTVLVLLGIFVLYFLFAIVLPRMVGTGQYPKATATATPNPDAEPRGIHTACHRVVSKGLVSPTSAKWSGIDEEPVSRISPTEWRVSGTVDSANRFGVMLRMRWTCIATRQPDGKETVRAESLSE